LLLHAVAQTTTKDQIATLLRPKVQYQTHELKCFNCRAVSFSLKVWFRALAQILGLSRVHAYRMPNITKPNRIQDYYEPPHGNFQGHFVKGVTGSAFLS